MFAIARESFISRDGRGSKLANCLTMMREMKMRESERCTMQDIVSPRKVHLSRGMDRVCALSSLSLRLSRLSISDAGMLFGEGVKRDATVRVRWRSHCDAAFIRPVEAFAKR